MAPILGCGWCTCRKKQAAKVPTSVEICSSARLAAKFTFAGSPVRRAIEVLTALRPYRPCTQVLTSTKVTKEMDVFLVAFQKPSFFSFLISLWFS